MIKGEQVKLCENNVVLGHMQVVGRDTKKLQAFLLWLINCFICILYNVLLLLPVNFQK